VINRDNKDRKEESESETMVKINAQELKLIVDYKENDQYRESFNELVRTVFGFDFVSWYDGGYWGDAYVCHSYLDGDKVIANVSTAVMDLIWKGKAVKALQIGTVMTHPDYRGQGLSGKLMEAVIERYQGQYDFIYLFASETVLKFYPKFGFERIYETEYEMKLPENFQCEPSLIKLNIEDSKDLELVKRIVASRKPVTNRLAHQNDYWLLMFYFTKFYGENLYYCEEKEAIVVLDREGNQVKICEVVAENDISLDALFPQILEASDKVVSFDFIPEETGFPIESMRVDRNDSALFVLGMPEEMKEGILFARLWHI